jgi:hypothetical protein
MCYHKTKTYSIVEVQSMSIGGVENSSFWATFSYETQQNPKPSHMQKNVNKTLNPKTLWTEIDAHIKPLNPKSLCRDCTWKVLNPKPLG